MITIDGSEGGGQLLRSALSLSALFSQSFKITNIRGARKEGGLKKQHLSCVNALKQVCGAEVEGAVLGSTELFFSPNKIKSGKYFFDIGTAGSTTLVLQSLLPALLFAKKESEVVVRGGTNVEWSPLTEYLEFIFFPLLSRMSAKASLRTTRRGWYPKGGGEISCRVNPVNRLTSLQATERGQLKEIIGYFVYSALPSHVVERQNASALKTLERFNVKKTFSTETAVASSPGTSLFLQAVHENFSTGFSALGALGKPAEKVGEEAAQKLVSFEESEAVLDEHAGDQILLFTALAENESILKIKLTKHVLTSIRVIECFLGKTFCFQGKEDEVSLMHVTPNNSVL